MERRRRTINEIEGDREARSIAIGLGRVVRETRRRRRLTQSALAGAVGLRRSRISEIERGLAAGTPLIVWVRLGMVLGRRGMAAVDEGRATKHRRYAKAGFVTGAVLPVDGGASCKVG